MTTVIRVLLVIALGLAMGFRGQPSTIADHEIESAIAQRLAMDGRINPKAIQVKVDNGTATLSGSVGTLTEKALAEHLVVSTYGVKSVNNQLNVRPAPTKDIAVEQAVKEALKSTPALQKSDIQVSVNDGVVTVKGAVEKPSQSLAAEVAAKTVPGVVRVVNMLKVIHPRPDREIEKDVVFYLQSSSLVNLDDVNAVVKNGVVTLNGSIDNLSHKYLIANDLERIHGVKTVDVSGLNVKSTTVREARQDAATKQ
ncbi:MAG TPA: BON domain-containing protein [Nitrospira sp.]|nr:BON domain-containing protein [Nitrospira sp.]